MREGRERRDGGPSIKGELGISIIVKDAKSWDQ
jgi:hypothetical protein